MTLDEEEGKDEKKRDGDKNTDIISFLFLYVFQCMIAAVVAGIFDDIEYIGKGDWVADTAVAHLRGYDVDITRRFLNTLAVIKLLDRGKTSTSFAHSELFVCEHRLL